ncbi:MAG TPA: TrkA family potassium uptake protein [Candidatus Limnocylindrales bacterium]|nr:TrkA family potassium uptake protein [Candidatus Limnocylindrales bacterium]
MKQSVLVIGLGRFGMAAARELMSIGHEVLAVDRDEALVNDIAPDVTSAVQADASDVDALEALGAADFDHAIVAISGDAQSSIFATMALRNLGVGNVVAKAGTALHGSILERVGATRVVFPELEMGTRIAHAFASRHVADYLDIAPGSGIVRFAVPDEWVGQTLDDLDIPGRGLTLIALRHGDRLVVSPAGSTPVAGGDELVVIGPDDRLDALEPG